MNKILIIFIFIIVGCELLNPPKVIITKEYIENPYWDEYNSNIFIEKLKLIDTTKVLKSDIEEIRKGFLLLEVDSSFRYGYYGNSQAKPYSKEKPSPLLSKIKKVYFNKDNGFVWNTGRRGFLITEKKVIGNLENNTWYKLSELGGHFNYIYVYVDNNGKAHTFIQDLEGPF